MYKDQKEKKEITRFFLYRKLSTPLMKVEAAQVETEAAGHVVVDWPIWVKNQAV